MERSEGFTGEGLAEDEEEEDQDQDELPEAPGCSGAGSRFQRGSRSESSGEGNEEMEDEEEEEEEEVEAAAAAVERGARGPFGMEEGAAADSDGEEERMINLSELAPYIMCSICKGYFIDATTITECLHTFCKSCIVRHFYYSNRCPKCNMVVHQTQPLYNIRLDRQLQDIVYKLVVNLEEREKKQIHDFYRERGLEVPKPGTSKQSDLPGASHFGQKDIGDIATLHQRKALHFSARGCGASPEYIIHPQAVPQPVAVARGRPRKVVGSVFRIPPELDMSLLLEFIGANDLSGNFKPLEKKFVRVSGEATIGHVEKFLRRKMDLDPGCQVDIICGDHLLEHYQTLREIRRALGENALQDGLLVLHYGLILRRDSAL